MKLMSNEEAKEQMPTLHVECMKFVTLEDLYYEHYMPKDETSITQRAISNSTEMMLKPKNFRY